MSRVIKIARFIIIQSAMQLSSEDKEKKKEEKKKANILRMMKKMIDGFMIRESETSI